MSVSSNEFSSLPPGNAEAAFLATPQRFRLFNFMLAPFRDIDGRVERELAARRAAKMTESEGNANRR